MIGWRVGRYALLAEVIVCFGPLAVFLLIGAATLPLSLPEFVSALFTPPQAGHDDVPLWALAAPIVAVIGGGCGLFALLAVVQALYAQRQTLAYPRNAVLAMMIAGWVTLLAIGVFGSTDAEHAGSRLLFFWLPMLSSVHILFLARRLLFGTPKPI